MNDKKLFSIGHSNLSIADFINLLQNNKIQVLVDVRAQPYSKYAKGFNKAALEKSLTKHKIQYIFMGKLLGGPSKDENYILVDGTVDYNKREKETDYVNGISQLKEVISKYNTTIMCAEGNPAKCHRHILIAKTLVDDGINVLHIISDGRLINAMDIGFAYQKSLFK